ncbi:P-loop NTPase [Desulfobacca acetoxidans]
MSKSSDKSHEPSCSQCGSKGSSCEHSHDKHPEHFEKALARSTLNRIQHKFLVMSGKGGVGKSSVAVALAMTLARQGYRVGLMDVDLHGPNVLRMLGLNKPLDPTTTHLFFTVEGLENLKVVSVEAFMPDRESAVIWRGPLKHQAIQQFISDVDWGELDYLIIDAPPGTGDEPLSVIQTIPEAEAIIVTTPQEISLADVRKSIDFCRKTNMAIVGLVENMSRLICPGCGKEIQLFSSGGGQRLAAAAHVPLLGSLPFDPHLVELADMGRITQLQPEESPFLKAFGELVKGITAKSSQ